MNTVAPISVLVPVKNEILNIKPCLESVVGWADEVVVLDSHSTDGTAEFALAQGAKVVQFDYTGGWPKKKNWAMRNLPLRNDWILILDADERLSTGLRKQMEGAIKNSIIDGYYIRWKFMFLGTWMKHCWSEGWMLRLLRKGCGEYEDLGMRNEGGWDNEVHENLVVHGKTGTLSELLLHDSNQDLSFWLAKHNAFSTWSVRQRLRLLHEPMPTFRHFLSISHSQRRKLLRAIFIRLPFRPLIRFFYLYVLQAGFLDGRAGFYFCALRAAHELTIGAKLFEFRTLAE